MPAPAGSEPRRCPGFPGYLGKCPDCDKATFSTRKTAKQYARRLYPGKGLHPYACPHRPEGFHVGHLAPEVVSGEVSKDLFYGPAGIGVHRYHCRTLRTRKGRS